MPTNFRFVDRGTAFLLTPSVDEGLPEDHLARFVVVIVDELDISSLNGVYTASGSDAYHPRMMLALLFYCYATGTFSSRKMEAATVQSRPAAGRSYPGRGHTMAAEHNQGARLLRKAQVNG